MKILYGVQGTGNGHITRARHMASALSRKPGVSVDYLFSGRNPEAYFDMQCFGQYQHARGLTFITENGKIQYRKTVTQNNLFSVVNEIRQTTLGKYDLVINDFEPISAWAAKLSGIPSIAISHQAAFLHRVPKHKQNVLDKVITKYFAPTTHSLGTHWYHFGYDIIPPFIAQELLTQQTSVAKTGEEILVYLPFENPKRIQAQLHVLREYKFKCYHPSITEARMDKNIFWQPPSKNTFQKDLAKCNGVIGNSGFELSTECLALGKPLLVKPLDRQYEQLSNAYTLKKLGACDVMHNLEAEYIDEWLLQKQCVQIQYPTNCNLLVDWLVQGNWQNKHEICKTLWSGVHFPEKIRSKLAAFA